MRTLPLVLSLVSTVCLAAGHPVTQPTFGASPLFPTTPSVAASNDRFLTIWTASNRLYSSLADRDGNALTPAAVPLADSYLSAKVVSAGDHFVALTSVDQHAALNVISLDGKLVSSVATPVPMLTDPQFAWNGDEFAIVDQGSTPLTAHFLRADGTAVKTNIAFPGRVNAYAIVGTPADWLLVTAEKTGVFLQRVGRDGTLGSRSQIQSATTQSPVRIAIATSGEETLVYWMEQQLSPLAESLWSAVIEKDGTIQPARELPVPPGPVLSTVLLQWAGQNYVAVVSGQQSFAFRLDRSGAPLDSPELLGEAIDSMAVLGDVVYGAGKRFSFGPDRPLIGSRFHVSNIADVRQQTISISLRQQSAPAIASDGVNFFSAWIDEGGEGKTILAARIGRGGVSLDPQGIDVGGPRTLYLGAPGVAYGNGVYVVVWSDTKNVLARRFRTDGSPVDGVPLTLGAGWMYFAPAVAWNGSAFITAWTDGNGAASSTIGIDGPPGPTIRLSPYPFLWPDLAWNGSEFLLVGGLGQTCPFECPVTHGVTIAIRLRADGSPIDTNAILVDVARLTDYSRTSRATVASDGRDFLVSLDGARDVVVVPVSAAGVLGAQKRVFKWFGGIQSDIASDDSGYVLTWNYRGPTINRTWLATAHLDSSGNPSSTVYTPLDTSTTTPSVAANSLGDSLSVVGTEDQPSGVVRVQAFLNWEMRPLPQPPAPPRNASATGDPHNFDLQWSGASPDTEGIVVDYVASNGERSAIVVLPVGQPTARFRNVAVSWVEVRAFNAGGMSEPLAVGVWPAARHRTTR